MKEWLTEIGKACAWLFLFLFTYALFLGGATFVVHSWYALARHLLIGLPNLGIAPDEGPQVAKMGERMLIGGLGLLAASGVSGRFCFRMYKRAAKESRRERLS